MPDKDMRPSDLFLPLPLPVRAFLSLPIAIAETTCSPVIPNSFPLFSFSRSDYPVLLTERLRPVCAPVTLCPLVLPHLHGDFSTLWLSSPFFTPLPWT